MGVYIDPPDGVDWSAYPAVSVDVYAPAEASGFIAQIFMKTGDDWAWVNTPDTQLVPGEWNTLTADLSAMGDAAAVKEIGVKVGTSVTAFTGAFYVDNITLVGTDDAKKN
jgi:mannan endo-1,4-beta-mannosidase